MSKTKSINSSKLPSIYRLITEKYPILTISKLKIFLFSLVLGFIVILIVLKSISLIGVFLKIEEVKGKRAQIVKQREYWQDVLSRHSGYRDAYFQLAILSFQLNEPELANKYIGDVLKIDPNYIKAKEFKSSMED